MSGYYKDCKRCGSSMWIGENDDAAEKLCGNCEGGYEDMTEDFVDDWFEEDDE